MRIKKGSIWCCKALLAGCFAFVILTLFCMLYFNVPVHYPNPDGATDYKWQPDRFYSRGTEGFAWGTTNNDGFMNSIDYSEGMNIDILIMGSSHMEAYQVSQKDSLTGRLHALLHDKTVYNIGVSGHTFLTCCANFTAALQKYHPSAYVVLETASIRFSKQGLQAVLDGTLPELPDYSGGIRGLLSKNPFLRCIYTQFKRFSGSQDMEEDINPASLPCSPEDNTALVHKVLASLARTAAQYGIKILIVYHPLTRIRADGSLLLPDTPQERKNFADLCSRHGIILVDMSERFLDEYQKNHRLPHGFINSSVGNGHLNSSGHAMIAQEAGKILLH